MNQNIFQFIVRVLAVILIGPSLWAEPNQQLTDYFSQKFSQMQAVGLAQSLDPSDPPTLIQDYNFDLTASVSIGISKVLNLSISPEIDFVMVPPDTDTD